jgi:hypothetical protein
MSTTIPHSNAVTSSMATAMANAVTIAKASGLTIAFGTYLGQQPKPVLKFIK